MKGSEEIYQWHRLKMPKCGGGEAEKLAHGVRTVMAESGGEISMARRKNEEKKINEESRRNVSVIKMRKWRRKAAASHVAKARKK